ncbi:unnamed protein product [Lepidochelys olivacea]
MLLELNKKGDDDKEEDKDGDYSQEEYGTRIDTAEQLVRKHEFTETEDLKVEEVLLEVQVLKDLSAFVEIDLRDEVEEITEHFLTEEKQPEEEEEPAELEAQKQLAVLLSNLDKAEEEKDTNRIAMKRT